MGLSDTLRKNTRVLRVEEQVDACELNVFASSIPVASVDIAFLIIAVDKDGAPVSTAVTVSEKALAANWVEATIFGLTEWQPAFAKPVADIASAIQAAAIRWKTMVTAADLGEHPYTMADESQNAT